METQPLSLSIMIMGNLYILLIMIMVGIYIILQYNSHQKRSQVIHDPLANKLTVKFRGIDCTKCTIEVPRA